MSIKNEVGQATWDSWPVAARMAIERLERQLMIARQDAIDDSIAAATEQRWRDRAEEEGVPYGTY